MDDTHSHSQLYIADYKYTTGKTVLGPVSTTVTTNFLLSFIHILHTYVYCLITGAKIFFLCGYRLQAIQSTGYQQDDVHKHNILYTIYLTFKMSCLNTNDKRYIEMQYATTLISFSKDSFAQPSIGNLFAAAKGPSTQCTKCAFFWCSDAEQEAEHRND